MVVVDETPTIRFQKDGERNHVPQRRAGGRREKENPHVDEHTRGRRRALRVMRKMRAHDTRNLAKNFISGSVWPAYNAGFGSRPRALHHMSYSSASCRNMMASGGGLSIIDKETRDRADAEDRLAYSGFVRMGKSRHFAETAGPRAGRKPRARKLCDSALAL